MELFARYFSTVKFLMEETLSLISSLIIQEQTRSVNKDLAVMATECWGTLVQQTAAEYEAEQWDMVMASFKVLMEATTPSELTEKRESKAARGAETIGLSFNTGRVMLKKRVQLMLISTITEIVLEFSPGISVDHMMTVVTHMRKAAEFAHNFNRQPQLRAKLQAGGLRGVSQQQLPSMLPCETTANQRALDIMGLIYTGKLRATKLFETRSGSLLKSRCPEKKMGNQMHVDISDERRADIEKLKDLVEPKLVDLCCFIAEVYSNSIDPTLNEGREPCILGMLEVVANDFTQEHFQRHIVRMFPYLSSLIRSPNHKIRDVLATIFTKRLTPYVTVPESQQAKESAS